MSNVLLLLYHHVLQQFSANLTYNVITVSDYDRN